MEELMKKVRREYFPLCVQKAQLITKMYRETEGEPESLRQAKAFAHVLENIPIWIDEEELIAGHAASKPWGVEIDPFLGPIDIEMLKGLEQEGVVVIDEEDWSAIREVAEYWRRRNWQYRTWQLTDERLWKFLQVGICYKMTMIDYCDIIRNALDITYYMSRNYNCRIIIYNIIPKLIIQIFPD